MIVRRILIWSVAALLTLLLVMLFTGYWLTQTNGGANWLATLAQSVVAELELEDVRGTLASGLEVRSVRYANDNVEVTATDVAVKADLNPARLLRRELWLGPVSIGEVVYTPFPRNRLTAENSGQAASPVSLPVALLVRDARIERLMVEGETPQVVTDISLDGHWRNDTIEIACGSATVGDVQIDACSRIVLRDLISIDGNASWRLAGSDGYRGDATFSGPLDRIEVTHGLQGRYEVVTEGTLNLADNTRFDLVSRSDRLEFQAGNQTIALTGATVTLAGSPDDYDVDFAAGLAADGLLTADVSGSGTGTMQGLQLADARLASNEGALTASGDIAWSPALAGSLSVRLDGLDPAVLLPDFPGHLDGSVRLTFEQSGDALLVEARELDIQGRVREYPLKLRGELRREGDGMVLDGLELMSNGSRLTASGTVTLAGSPAWNLELVARQLDPSLVVEDWPGKLDGRALFAGQSADDKLTYRFDQLVVNGTLREQPLSVRGRVSHDAGLYRFDDLQVTSGPNRLALSGSAGRRLDLRYDADLANLGTLGREFAGKLAGKGRVGGSLQAPQIALELNGTGLRMPGYAIENIAATGQLVPQTTGSRLVIEAGGIEMGQTRIDAAAVTASGNIGEHTVDIEVALPGTEVRATLAGGWANERWTGQLLDSVLVHPPFVEWRQREALSASIDRESIALQRGCWQQESASVCIGGSATRSALDFNGEVDDASLAPLAVFLPPGVRVAGTGGAQFSLTGTPAEPRLEAVAIVPAVDLAWHYADDEETGSRSLRDVRVETVATMDRVDVQATLAGTNEGRLALTGNLAAWRTGTPVIDARIEGGTRDASLLEVLLPGVANVSGAIDVDLSVNGPVDQPAVRGYLRYRDGVAELRQVGIRLTEITLDVEPADRTRLAFSGSARSGDGPVQVQGEIDLDRQAGWPVRGTLTGERFTAISQAGLEVVVSPDLEISGDARHVRVAGTVRVPRAQVRLRELPPQAVSVSPDARVVSDDGAETARSSLFDIYADIELVLGDEVRFAGFGLETGLSGQLELVSEPGRPMEGRGTVELVDGKFQAYGRRLNIESGSLLFTGALDDPVLDVQATRRIEDVTVGVRLGGTAQSPVSSVYSEPSMSDSDTLSYLIVGRPLSAATRAEGNQVRESALLLGLSQASMVTDQIGRSVGLDELRLAAGSTVDTGAIMAGKQVSNDLYVRYSYGLFNRIGSLMLRYRLNSRISLEARAAEDQSIDVIYSRETH